MTLCDTKVAVTAPSNDAAAVTDARTFATNAPVPNAAFTYWDQTAGEWQNTNRQFLWRRHSDAVYVDFLSRRLPVEPVDRLLKTDMFDEAVAHGLVPMLTLHARHVVGIDISPVVVAAARHGHPGFTGIATDIRSIPFANSSFDLIVSNSTLDHFQTQAEINIALSEIARVLRPGGELLLTLDNPANPVVALRNALPFSFLHRLGIVPYFVGATCGGRALRASAEAAGLAVLETTYVLHCPRVFCVAAARVLRNCSPRTQSRFLRFMKSWEILSRLPTRAVTGYYVALHARKR